MALRLRLRKKLRLGLKIRLRRMTRDIELRPKKYSRGPGGPAKEVTKFRKIRTDEVLRI